jgi:hypothetical protein
MPIFFGPIDMTKNVPIENYMDALTMARMEMTALGVALYLFVEVALWPIVPRTIVRQEGGRWFGLVASVIHSIDLVTRVTNTLTLTSTDTTRAQQPPPPLTPTPRLGSARSAGLAGFF